MTPNTTPSSESTNEYNIQTGDVLFWQDSNKVIKLAQQTQTASYASSTHTGVVTKIDNLGQIHILEAAPGGIKVNVYNQKTFKKTIGYGIVALRSKKSELRENIGKSAQNFAKEYAKENNKTRYAYDHLVHCAIKSIHDNKTGRKRTVHSLEHGKLMTSTGKTRKAAICSEVVAEVVKVAQLTTSLEKDKRADVPQKELVKALKEYQKAGAVLALNSETTSPAELEKNLINNFEFETIWIKKS